MQTLIAFFNCDRNTDFLRMNWGISWRPDIAASGF